MRRNDGESGRSNDGESGRSNDKEGCRLAELYERMEQEHGVMMPWLVLLASSGEIFHRVLGGMTEEHVAGPEPLTCDPAEKAVIATAMQVAKMATENMVRKAMSSEDTANTLLRLMAEMIKR